LSAGGGPGLAGTVQKSAYLGSFQEVTLDTALGAIFVVSPDLEHAWAAGDPAVLGLSGHGVSVVAA
jgi:iron(III) transport system ATP-binding protein